jgi:hypothetical protein
MAMREARGDHRVATKQDPHVMPRERERMGGGRYDAGPGRGGLPSAAEMDRPPTPCGTFSRTGDSRGGIDRGIRKIQDQERGRE